MGKKKKKREDPVKQGAPEWVVTFTDMISLLVTFFVLLMTFSSMDAYEALKVDSFLKSNSGLLKSKGTSMPDLGEADLLSSTSVERGANHPHSRPPEKLSESLEEMGQKRTEEHQALNLNDVRDGLVLEFGEEETFDPGSAVVSSGLRRSLIEIAKVLENYPHLVVLEGFTDSAFKPTPEHPSADALSLARARNAADAMLANSAMLPELLQISGHGAESPRADNLSPGGRRMNRRVQIRVLSISKARSTYLAAKKEREG